jgi:O-antigen/teichoic acid export membrane protein
VDWAACRILFEFSIYRFIWIVANQLIFYSDALVIALFLGAGAITPYAIAGSLINYGRHIVSLLTDTLYPAAARMDAKQDLAGLRQLLVLGTRMSLLVTFPLCLGFLFLGRQFLTLWMGPAYADSAVVLMVLTIPQFGSMSQYTSALILAGMAKHRALAYFVLVEGTANLILSIVLVQKIGLMGVAWGTVIPHLICTTVLVPLYTMRVLGMSARDYIVKAYLRPTVSAVPLVALGYTFSTLEATSWVKFAAEAMAMCGAFGVIAYFVCLSALQRASAMRKIGALVHRQAIVGQA